MKRSRKTTIGKKDGKTVYVAYGFDYVPGFKPGYFFQVYEDPEDEPIVNEGFINGISKERLKELMDEYQVNNTEI